MTVKNQPVIYETNAALGFREYAYLIRLDKSKHGYNYLCIGTVNVSGDNSSYQIGELVDDLENIYVEVASNYKLEDSPLHGNYMFNFLLDNIQLIR